MVKNTISYKYYIKDHLGNNRVVSDHEGNVMQYTNYYPYGGMLHLSTNPGYQKFKYNGKEYDTMHGLNEYDYSARQYDPAIAQFTSMDPLCEKYYHISPYAYCGRNPVNRVDPDGMDWYERDGKRIWRNSVDGTYTDKQGNEWTNIGHTYTDSKTGMYYSLFGQKYTKYNKNLNAVRTIDNALLSYAKYESEMGKAYEEHDYKDILEPTFDFSQLYPFVKDNTLFRLESPNIHHITYGDDNNKGYNTIISQVSDTKMARARIDERFIDMDIRGYNKTSLKGVGIIFKNSSRKDLVSIILRPKRGKMLHAFYRKLVNSYK